MGFNSGFKGLMKECFSSATIRNTGSLEGYLPKPLAINTTMTFMFNFEKKNVTRRTYWWHNEG